MNTFKSVKNVTIHYTTISKYLEYLTDYFLIMQAKKYDLKGKKYINSPSKYYFTDIGLRNARLNFRELEQTHIMENIIYNELIYRGYSVYVGTISINEKNQSGTYSQKQLEVDFVCNNGSKRYYIQSALALPSKEKMIQETKSLLNINDSFKKIIIVKDTIKAWYTEEGIFIINLYDFLLNPNLIDF